MIRPSKTITLYGYIDTDWTSNVDGLRSTRGYYIFIGDNFILWSSKKQHVVAQSDTESEYRALAHAAAEISDTLAPNPIFHAQTKHIVIYVHFIRDKVLQNKFEVRYIPSIDKWQIF